MAITQFTGPRRPAKKPEEDWATPVISALGTVGGAALGGPVGAAVGGILGQAAGRATAPEGSRVTPAGRGIMALSSALGGEWKQAGAAASELAGGVSSDGLQKLLMERAGAMPEGIVAPTGMSRDQHWANWVSADPFIQVRAEQRAWEEDPENAFQELGEWMKERDFDPSSQTQIYEQLPSYAAAKQLHLSRSPYGKLEQTGYQRPPSEYLDPESAWSDRGPLFRDPDVVEFEGRVGAEPRPAREPRPIPSPAGAPALPRPTEAVARMPQVGLETTGAAQRPRPPVPGMDLPSAIYGGAPPPGPPGLPGVPLGLQEGPLGAVGSAAPGVQEVLQAVGWNQGAGERLGSLQRGRERLRQDIPIPFWMRGY
jgi:hypothetical protein